MIFYRAHKYDDTRLKDIRDSNRTKNKPSTKRTSKRVFASIAKKIGETVREKNHRLIGMCRVARRV